MAWLDRSGFAGQTGSLECLVELANNPKLYEQVRAFETIVYGRKKPGERQPLWPCENFLKALTKARRKLRSKTASYYRESGRLLTLNPLVPKGEAVVRRHEKAMKMLT